MGKILRFRTKPKPNRRIVIEINEKTDKILKERKKAEGLSSSDLFNRALQTYGLLCEIQEKGGKPSIDGEEFRIT